MTKEQDIYQGMFLTFENTVTVHEAALVKWPEVLAARDLIRTKKGDITGLAIIQSQGASTEEGFKSALRKTLNGHYAEVVKAIEGNIGGDAGLQARYKKITPSGLKTVRDTDVESDVLEVVQDAEGMLAKLDRSDITAAKLSEMKVLASNYSKAIGAKGTAKDLAVRATADLAALFDMINEELRKLNDVVKGMPESMAVQRSAIQAARKIANV